jgi:hypothetical protein
MRASMFEASDAEPESKPMRASTSEASDGEPESKLVRASATEPSDGRPESSGADIESEGPGLSEALASKGEAP